MSDVDLVFEFSANTMTVRQEAAWRAFEELQRAMSDLDENEETEIRIITRPRSDPKK